MKFRLIFNVSRLHCTTVKRSYDLVNFNGSRAIKKEDNLVERFFKQAFITSNYFNVI